MYDHALAESVLSLFETEVIHRRGPWGGFDVVGYAPLEWVAWFNQQHLLALLGYFPLAEFETQFYRRQDQHLPQTTQTVAAALNYTSHLETQGGSSPDS